MEWPAILTAISTTAIALVAVGFVVGALPLLRQAVRTTRSLEKLAASLEHDAKPLLESVRSAAGEASQMAAKLRGEVDGVVDTSKEVRERVLSVADAAEDRLLDLEALLDVFQSELEDTVLDVSAALRTTRRGSAILGAMKRAFLGTGKKRRRKRRR